MEAVVLDTDVFSYFSEQDTRARGRGPRLPGPRPPDVRHRDLRGLPAAGDGRRTRGETLAVSALPWPSAAMPPTNKRRCTEMF